MLQKILLCHKFEINNIYKDMVLRIHLIRIDEIKLDLPNETQNLKS